MKTLAELNAQEFMQKTRTWSTLVLKSRYAIGQAGNRRTGQLTHLLVLDDIVGTTPEHVQKPGYLKVGDVFSSRAVCGTRSNGQHTSGRVYAHLDTKDITCSKCGGPSRSEREAR